MQYYFKWNPNGYEGAVTVLVRRAWETDITFISFLPNNWIVIHNAMLRCYSAVGWMQNVSW